VRSCAEDLMDMLGNGHGRRLTKRSKNIPEPVDDEHGETRRSRVARQML
jgi:hypothetical protein